MVCVTCTDGSSPRLVRRVHLFYRAADGGSGTNSDSDLAGLAIVIEGAVYSNGTASLNSFVDKPPARKRLSDKDHLRKVTIPHIDKHLLYTTISAYTSELLTGAAHEAYPYYTWETDGFCSTR